MTAINTNIKSLITQNALIKNNRALGTAMEQLSTGKRINSAADDAAGLAVSNRMSAQIQGLDQAVRNANDGISLIQTAEGSLNEVTSMLQRMRELSIQSSNDTYTPEDRGFLDLEFQQLKAEINRVANNTEWNGMGILNKSPTAGNGSGKFEFQVGANADQLISIQLQDFRTDPVVIAQPGTTNTVLSSGTANLSNTILAKKATATVAPVTAQPQNSVLTLSGAYAAGDTIKLDMVFGSTTNTFTYSVKASDIVVADSAATLANIRSAIVSQSGIDASLGVTLSTGSTAGTIEFTGPPGVSFTPQVTTTIAVGGKATAQTETAGTSSTRETNSIVLTGDYKKGDVITVNNGTNAINYTVKDTDAGTANLGTLASNIAASAIGYLANTTVDVDVANKTIKFTATTFGSDTLNLTSSVQYASDKFDTTAAVIGTSGSTTAIIPPVPPVTAQPQNSVLTLSGAYAAGDTIKLDMVFGSTTNTFTYSVKASDIVVADSAATLANIRSAIVSQSGIDASLGVTLSTGSTAGTIEFTGPPGVSFTPQVTTTIAVGGKATAQTETAGTSSTRETNSIVLTGDYKKGDVITVNNGTNAINYTVKDTDAGTANLGTLASNIAASAIGYLANTTVDVDVANKTIKFTATTFGSDTLNLTSSVQYASDKFDTTAAVIGTSGSPGVPSTPAVAQVDQLTVAGIFDTGDKVRITINGTAYDYTVSDSDTQADNMSEAIAKGLALTFLEASPAPAVSVARSGSSISFTGNADGTPFTSNVNVTRAGVTTTTDPVIGKPAGSLNMINETAILTRANANTAIESVDAAMSVINQSRAVMGAVMNRLTYAGENLINVAQNTTESRSRILDADFAKASSELARTQIISQAATSVLAQANTEQQSVLKLLQG